MSDYLILCLAGFGAGVINAIAGGGTFLTFPATAWHATPALETGPERRWRDDRGAPNAGVPRWGPWATELLAPARALALEAIAFAQEITNISIE